MFITNHRGVFFTITGLILVASIAAIVFFRLPLSIDFTGGSLIEASYMPAAEAGVAARPPVADLAALVAPLGLGEVSIRESGVDGVLIRTRTLSPEQHNALLAALSQNGAHALTEQRFTSIGPSLGTELGKKALIAILAVIAAIVLYIAWAFRRVSKPVSSWVYGFTIVVILIHDLIVPAGFYAVLAHYTGAQVDTLFVVALLAILGYSVNDTIVIFDRVREHLAKNHKMNVKQPFDEVVGRSITETLGRSINTSLTVVLALLALVFIGSPVTRDFALVLLVGVVAGTYSSILLAAPLLIPLAKRFAKVEVSRKK